MCILSNLAVRSESMSSKDTGSHISWETTRSKYSRSGKATEDLQSMISSESDRLYRRSFRSPHPVTLTAPLRTPLQRQRVGVSHPGLLPSVGRRHRSAHSLASGRRYGQIGSSGPQLSVASSSRRQYWSQSYHRSKLGLSPGSQHGSVAPSHRQLRGVAHSSHGHGGEST